MGVLAAGAVGAAAAGTAGTAQPVRGRHVHALAAASGSIKRTAIRQAAEDVLEGGRAARMLREATYGAGGP